MQSVADRRASCPLDGLMTAAGRRPAAVAHPRQRLRADPGPGAQFTLFFTAIVFCLEI